MKVGVLALQGAFAEHEKALERLGADWAELRQKKDLNSAYDALILCGGESTVQGKLLRELDMFDTIRAQIEEGMPTFGTCAGLILLAKGIYGGEPPHLGTMDVVARRNAYGRQLGSFYCEREFADLGKIPMTFIRAPYIESVGDGVDVLSVVDGRIVAARQKNMLACSFHPELTQSLAVHKYFINNFVK
ncbi:MAG: pyridoxal 5'-phosphate synthase glutaminase subunit PdxT [Candidatus Coproplasma sp.]